MTVSGDSGMASQRLPRLRILWSFACPHVGTLVLGLILSLAKSALGLSTPMVTKWVLDSLHAGRSLRDPIVVLLVLLVVGAFVGYLQWSMLGALGERVVLEARESLVRRFLRATVPAITARPVGEMVTRVTSDTLLLRDAAAGSAVGVINGVVMLVGTLILMSVLDPLLLGATVAALAVVTVLFALLMPATARAEAQAQEHVGRLGGTLEGTLHAVRTVKVSRAEDRLAGRIIFDAREAAAQGIRAKRSEAAAVTIFWGGLQLAIIMVLGLGAWQVGQGRLEASALVAFLLYAFGLIGPTTELSQDLAAMQLGVAAAQRIRETDFLDAEAASSPRRLLDVPAGVAQGAAPVVSPADRNAHVSHEDPVLELRNVTAAYGPDREPAVYALDLVVPRRGHTAIVGPSGAGKTTLFSLVLRFLEPRTGELFLDGRPYREYGHDQLRARLAYVEQDTPIVPGTIRDNLLFSHPDATDQELRQILDEIRLAEWVGSLDDLDTPLLSTSLSGGERQRIALARALLRTPDVLLLDEATAQLDGLTETAIHHSIRRRAAQGAVVTIAHRLSTVVDADTIVVMEAGRIRARGTHAELLAADELYRDLAAALTIPGPTLLKGARK